VNILGSDTQALGRSSIDALLLSALKNLNGENGWQMARNFIPAVAFVQAGKNRTAVRTKINARRLSCIPCHCLTEHGEKTPLLGQSFAHVLPALSAIA
jgi:hypothetical protein